MRENEAKTAGEPVCAQCKPVDVGGYHQVDENKASKAMRPGLTLNKIIDSVAA